MSEETTMSGDAGGGRSGFILRSSAIMAAGVMVSRVLGFVKTYFLGMALGGSVTVSANAYYAGNALPLNLWLLIGGGALNAILVPAVVRAMKLPDRGNDYMSRLLTLVMTFSFIATVLCMLASPLLLTLMNGGIAGETHTLALVFTLWLMPQIFFSGLLVVLGHILNAHESFGPYSWAPVVNNLITIAGAGLFVVLFGSATGITTAAEWSMPMIAVLCGFTTLGTLGQAAVLYPVTRKIGLRLHLSFRFRGLGLRKLATIGSWSLGMLILGQLGAWSSRWAAAKGANAAEAAQQAGSLADAARFPGYMGLDNSYAIFMLPQGLIAVTLVTAIFPSISRLAADDRKADIRRGFRRTERMLQVAIVFCAVALMVVAAPLLWVVIGGTTQAQSEATAWILRAFLLGLVGFSSSYLVKRVFYAYEDARTPFRMQIPVTAISIGGSALALSPLVPPQFAVAVAALGSALATYAGWALGLFFMRRRLGPDPQRRAGMLLFGKLVPAAVVAGAAGWGVLQLLDDLVWSVRPGAVLGGLVAGAVMAVVYGLVCLLLRVAEVKELLSMVTRRLPSGRRSR